ncbi:DUF4258 domain-containing protein [Streptomyces sp. 3MP-14]|uniref:DUF4258 domain-containing protein n=1 Tax=Streptomyces mimosae TaxID=2586635 RepID=A0A5N6AK76_9ACTN|nr:DUF4258 domain-containing protein [Streptomyces mimosae]KAB8178197.1 DUF4258 domain-containing protein [Streptomyces sp. 3MP-14]
MRLTFSNHAKDRMCERNISEGDVRFALSHHVERKATEKGSIRYRGPGLRGDMLKVWVESERGSAKKIKSVTWDGR